MEHELFSMLINQTCQVTLLAIAVWLVTRFFANNRPHLSHALWMLVLIKCLTPPVWSSPTSPFSWMNAKTTSPVQLAELSENTSYFGGLDSALNPDIVVHTDPNQAKFSIPALELNQQNGRKLKLPPQLVERQQSTESSLSITQVEPLRIRSLIWTAFIARIWLIGVVAGLIVCLFRFASFVFWLRRAPAAACPEVAKSLKHLKRKLRINRKIRVRVLNCPVGPAVMGLLRPTILLPLSVVQGKTARELEPLLAHELIHIRRGDVWWAMVQTLAKNLFWFHPLVWLANTMATRESERCCDEETVTSLGCSPAAYARKLVEVLEQKHKLRVAPALPGVRPIDITSARLERVMKIGHGSHRQTPFWIWLVMLIGGMIALPGAAMIVAQDDGETAAASTELKPLLESGLSSGFGVRIPNTILQNPPSINQPLRQPVNGVPVEGMDRVFTNAAHQTAFKQFDVRELLAIIRGAENQSLTPEKRLILELPCRYPIEGKSSTPNGRAIQHGNESGVIELGGKSPTMKIVGDTLYVYDTQMVLDAVEKELAHLKEDGFKQIVVETRFVNIDRDDLKKIGVDWSIGHSAAGELSNPQNNVMMMMNDAKVTYMDVHRIPSTMGGQPRSHSRVRAASYVEKSSPVIFSLLDDEGFREVVKFSRGSETANILQAPTVTMFNGQSAQVVDGVSRPFVVGLDRLKDANGNLTDSMQPVIRVVADGTTVSLQATSKPDDSVDLNCHVNVSKIVSVDTAEIPIKLKEGNYKIQIPEVATSQIQSTMNIPKGKTLVLGSFLDGEKGEKQNLLVMLKCTTIVSISEFPAHMISPNEISQADAAKIIGGDAMPMLSFMNEQGEFVVDEASVKASQEYYNKQMSEMVQRLTKKGESQELPKTVPTPPEKMHLKSGEKSDEAQDLEPLIEAFAKADIDLEVEGKINFEILIDRIVVTGNDLIFESESDMANGDPVFRASGKRGEIHVALEAGQELFLLKFEGDVKLQMDELVMSAEKINYGDNQGQFELKLWGNAKAGTSGNQAEEFQATADHIDFDIGDSEMTLLEGNAHLIYSDTNTNLKANRIEWNNETDEIKAVGEGSTSVDLSQPGDTPDAKVFSFHMGVVR